MSVGLRSKFKKHKAEITFSKEELRMKVVVEA
jgi:hypothetical protein